MTDLEYKRKKLLFRSEHRGTKEMDIILSKYAKEHLVQMDEDQLTIYQDLLKENDKDLYNWFLGKAEAPARYQGLIARYQTQPA